MATAVALPTYEEALRTAKGWQDKPPTYEERKNVIDTVAAALSKPEDRIAFEDRIKGVSTAAVEIGKDFAEIEEEFKILTDSKYAHFRKLGAYQKKWGVFKEDWYTNLQHSRDVASEMSAKLTRWDAMCRTVIKVIKTEEQREEALKLIKAFTEVESERSVTLAKAFNTLRGSLNPFSKDFSNYLETKGVTATIEVKNCKDDVTECEKAVK